MSMHSLFCKHFGGLLQTFRAVCSAKGARKVCEMCSKRVRNVNFIFQPIALFSHLFFLLYHMFLF